MPDVNHVQFRAMGGPCAITWYGNKDERLAQRLEAEVRRLEAKYSRFQPSSVLSQLNNNRNKKPIRVDEETAGLLDFADQCYRQSEGVFDVTTGVLRRVWDFESVDLPAQSAIDAILPRIGWQKIKWDGQYLNMPSNMELDLGGLVKEFAADRVRTLMIEAGVMGLVNLAGDIAVTGLRPDGQAWSVGISHPRNPQRMAAQIALQGGALATSGDYERFMMVKGQRYCHLLHPKTGWPSVNGPASVTIVAGNCLLAGALTTMAMLQGVAAESWLHDLGVPFLMFDNDLNVFGTLATN